MCWLFRYRATVDMELTLQWEQALDAAHVRKVRKGGVDEGAYDSSPGNNIFQKLQEKKNKVEVCYL